MLGHADQNMASSMSSCLSHRGPDGSGGFCEQFEGGGVAFGHARLSIVDIAGSPQPIGSDHGAVLIQNGEIYNQVRLRSQNAAYPWRTSGDSETILAMHRSATRTLGDSPDNPAEAHVEWLSQLDGIWGFSLWDPSRREFCLLYTSPSPRDQRGSRMPSSA